MSASTSWTEDNWSVLLASIEERRVIPIVGRDLLQVAPNGSPPVLLDQFVAGRLAADLGLTVPHDELTLNAVVCAHLGGGGRWSMLYSRVRDIMERADLEPPRVLRQLAEITDFSLFLTTNFDLLLEQAINDVRFDGQPGTVTLAYAPKIKPADLPTAIRSLPHPIVYHLLGVQSTMPSYVLCDEDLLEFVYGLQETTRRPELLFEELEDQHLLILGEGFSDWLTRLFLRITRSSRRLSDRREVMEFLAESPSLSATGLFQFLRVFSSSTEIYTGGGVVEFVDELHRRWTARHPVSTTVSRAKRVVRPATKGKDVFISYASDDRVAASVLKQELEDAGFSVWFDVRQLSERIGYKWETEIKNNIKTCTLFMPVLSAATEGRAEGYFRAEWLAAEARTMRQFASDRPFIVPVVVDETHGFKKVPDSFHAAQMSRLPGGRFTDGFADQLHAMIDEVTGTADDGGEAA